MLHQTITPRAFDAIAAQIDQDGDTGGTFYAVVNGQELEFTARFKTEWTREQRYSDTHSNGFGYDDLAECTLVGCYAFDPETGERCFAGNRAETVDLIGPRKVCSWEYEQSERETE